MIQEDLDQIRAVVHEVVQEELKPVKQQIAAIKSEQEKQHELLLAVEQSLRAQLAAMKSPVADDIRTNLDRTFQRADVPLA